MRSGWILSIAVTALGLGLTTSALLAEKAAPRMKTKEIMGKYFKGKETPITKAISGESGAGELKELRAAFQALASNKPSKGDAEGWKTKTAALISATDELIAKKEGAAAKLQAASNCKACHDDYKGK